MNRISKTQGTDETACHSESQPLSARSPTISRKLSQVDEQNSDDFSTFRKWIILILVTGIFLVRSYGVTCFATVNDVTSAYFHIQPAKTDLLSTIIFVSKALACVVIAIFSEKLTPRFLIMAAVSAVAVGNVLVAIAISERSSYPVAVLGQGLNGLAAAALNTVPALVSMTWFPRTENGLAFSIPWAASRMSLALSGIISTHTFNLSRTFHHKSSVLHSHAPAFSNATLTSFKFNFQITFFTLSGIAIVLHVLSNIFVVAKSSTDVFNAKKGWSLLAQFEAIFALFKQRNFLALTFSNLLLLSIKPMVTVLLSSLILKSFPKLTDKTSGEIFCVASLVGAMGGPAAGFIIDRFNKSKIAALVGSIVLLLSCSMVVLAFHVGKVLMLYFAFTLVVFFREFTFVSITKVLMVNVSSNNKLRLASVFMTVPLMAVMGYSYAMRMLLRHGFVLLAVAFPLPFVGLVIILISCIETKYTALDNVDQDEE